MINVMEKLDSIFSGDAGHQVIYNPEKCEGLNFTTDYSRFNYPHCKYKPYELTYNNMAYLESHLKIAGYMESPLNFKNFSQFVCYYDVCSDNVTLWSPSKIENLLVKINKGNDKLSQNYDLSILGLIAIANRKFYGDKVFKEFVEENYLKKNFEYSETYCMWILNKANRDALDITKDFIIHLIDLNYAGINFAEYRIPYVFKWD